MIRFKKLTDFMRDHLSYYRLSFSKTSSIKNPKISPSSFPDFALKLAYLTTSVSSAHILLWKAQNLLRHIPKSKGLSDV